MRIAHKIIALLALLLPLTVTGAGNSVTLFSWQVPTQNTLGEALLISDLGGYRLYCGASPGIYSKSTLIPDALVIQFPINEAIAADGVNHCVVTSYDKAGNESPYSNEVRVFTQAGVSQRIAPAAPGLSLK